MSEDNLRNFMFYLGMALGMLGGWSITKAHFDDKLENISTAIHNAAATGDEIIIDGLRYRFVVVGKEE